VRNLLLDAELNEEYYRERGDFAQRLDRAVQICAAVASLGAVASWLLGHASGAWNVLLVVSAILSAASPIVRWFDDAVKFTNLASRWSELAGELRTLAFENPAQEEMLRRAQDISRRLEALQREDTSKPKQRLISAMRQRVEVRHGLAAATVQG
jgi:hypothetical protein